MDRNTSSHHRFFAEMKRRQVFRVAAVYGGVSFLVIQVADPLTGALRLPESFLTIITAVLLLGFPITVVLAWAFEVTPEGVQRTGAAAPGEIEQIIAQPASKRWPSGLLALAGVIALVAGAWFAGRRSGAAAAVDPAVAADAAPDRVADASIAVLPFVNMSSDAEQEYFSDGVSEELLNLLARIPELRVAARTSSFSFRDGNLEIPEIARRLNVAHVLEGSVRKADDRVRVTAQLIRADDGFHVWSETWDRTLDDIFAIQDEIAADVADHLRVTLLGETLRVEETDPEAYSLVLQARHLSEQRTPESLTRAEELFREALAVDPDYAPAWSGLSLAFFRQPAVGLRSPEERGLLSREAAEKALALDPGEVLAYELLARIALGEGDLEAAARHAERALQLEPGAASTVGTAALILESLGRTEEAIRLLEYQAARDPVSLAGHLNLGLAYLGAGRPADAAESFRTVLDLNPAAGSIRSFLATALVFADEADAALEIVTPEPNEPQRLIGLSTVYHALGRTAEADSALAELIEKYEQDWAYNIAYTVAYRGDVDRTFDWLDKAVTYEDAGLSEIFIRPEFEILQDDPRWPALLERIGKSPERLAAIEFDVELPR